MNNYVLLPDELKCLRKIKKSGSLPVSDVPNADKLLRYGVIKENHLPEQDEYLNFVSDGTVSVTDEYDRYIESHRWFTSEYVLSHLAVPLASAVIGGTITAIICALL